MIDDRQTTRLVMLDRICTTAGTPEHLYDSIDGSIVRTPVIKLTVCSSGGSVEMRWRENGTRMVDECFYACVQA